MFEKITLDNGVTIVMEKMPYVRSVSLGFFVKNGSINESIETNGISHFIEHMMFKGTKNRTSKEIAEDMDSIGGQVNAYTSKEYTCYYTRVLDTHINKALDVLTDMFFNSSFTQENIDKEASVILEEISMYEDSPEDIVFTELQKKIWGKSSLGYPILGSPENITKFKQKDFFDYLKKHYTAENIVISVAGNFEKESLIQFLNEKFSTLPKSSKIEEFNKTIKLEKSIVKIEKDIEQIHLCLVFNGVSLKSKYNYAMSILNTIFGGGMSSILFQKIREQNGLAYSIYSYNSSYVNNGAFNIYVALNPNQLDNALNMILDEIRLFKQNKFNKEQVLKTKEQLKSNYIMSLESTSNRMSSMGRSQTLINKVKTSDEIIKEVDNVTLEDLEKLTQEIFDIDNMSVSLVGKVSQINLKI